MSGTNSRLRIVATSARFRHALAGYRWLRHWCGRILGFLALAYLGFLLHSHRVEIVRALVETDPIALLFASLIACASLMLNAVYFERIISSATGLTHFDRGVALVWIRSQIVRYVPGRVWGIVYQGVLLRQRCTGKVIALAAAMQALTTGTLTLCVGVAALLCKEQAFLPALAVVALGAILVHQVHTSVCFGWPALLRHPRILAVPSRLVSVPVVGGTRLLLFDWVLRVGLWWCLMPRENAPEMAFMLAAGYALASTLSSVVSIVPGGLAIREGLFVFMGEYLGMEIDTLLAQAIVIRLVLTVAEVVLSAIAMIPGHHSEREPETAG